MMSVIRESLQEWSDCSIETSRAYGKSVHNCLCSSSKRMCTDGEQWDSQSP